MSERVGEATTARSLVAGGAAGAIEKILGGQEWLERVSKECQQEKCLKWRDSRWLRRASAASELPSEWKEQQRQGGRWQEGVLGAIERFLEGCRSGLSGYQKGVGREGAWNLW